MDAEYGKRMENGSTSELQPIAPQWYGDNVEQAVKIFCGVSKKVFPEAITVPWFIRVLAIEFLAHDFDVEFILS